MVLHVILILFFDRLLFFILFSIFHVLLLKSTLLLLFFISLVELVEHVILYLILLPIFIRYDLQVQELIQV